MNPDEYINFENRYYQNPTLTRDETLSFVDSLRDTVQKDNASIAKQTQSLGTDVPSNLGGLTGSQGYFIQRYQTTPMEYQFNALKATAQADALNKLMNNYKAQAANRYSQAYRNAKAAAAAGNGNGDSIQEEPEERYLTDSMTLDTNDEDVKKWVGRGETNISAYETPEGYQYYKNMDTGKMLKTNDPDWAMASDGYYYNTNQAKNRFGKSLSIGELLFNPVKTWSSIGLNDVEQPIRTLGGAGYLSDEDYANLEARKQEAANNKQVKDFGFFNSFLGF